MDTLPTLFGKDSKGKIKQWFIRTEGPDVVITHGQVHGKQQESRTTSKGKSIGKSNETTPEEQALLEAESKWRKQIKRDYAESIEEIPESTLPHLATKLQDKAHTLDYNEGVDVLCKLDGVRCSVFLRDGEIFFQSRGGEAYPVIEDMASELYNTYFVGDNNYNVVVDGEIYCHGMHLEDITAAVKKHNKDTPRLEFHAFDLIDKSKPDEVWYDRWGKCFDAYLQSPTSGKVEIVVAVTVRGLEELYEYHDRCVSQGYEGIVVRPHNGVNSFGNRTADFIKYKLRKDAEFKVVRMEVDKKGRALPWCHVDVNAGTGLPPVYEWFKAPLTGSDDRNQKIWQEYVDAGHQVVDSRKWLKVEFEAYSKYGIPAKPKGVCFRNCDPVTGEPLE